MMKSRFSDSAIIGILKQAEAGSRAVVVGIQSRAPKYGLGRHYAKTETGLGRLTSTSGSR